MSKSLLIQFIAMLYASYYVNFQQTPLNYHDRISLMMRYKQIKCITFDIVVDFILFVDWSNKYIL